MHKILYRIVQQDGDQIKMVERILEQETAIRQVLSSDHKSVHLIPSWQDIEILESLRSALGPLKNFTDILSGEKHVTISAVIPLLNHLFYKKKMTLSSLRISRIK